MKTIIPVGGVFEIGYGNDIEVILGVRSFEELAIMLGNAEINMINPDAAILVIDRGRVEATPHRTGGKIYNIRINGVPLRLVRAKTNGDNTVQIFVKKVLANVVSEIEFQPLALFTPEKTYSIVSMKLE